jgi:hypothetical protein
MKKLVFIITILLLFLTCEIVVSDNPNPYLDIIAPNKVEPGEIFNATIRMYTGNTGIIVWVLYEFSFNPACLEVLSLNLSSSCQSSYSYNGDFDNTNGKITNPQFFDTSGINANTSIDLLYITFKAKSAGTCFLKFTNFVAHDLSDNNVSFLYYNNSVIVNGTSGGGNGGDSGDDDIDNTTTPPPHNETNITNNIPVAIINCKNIGCVNETFVFDGNESYDINGSIVSYQWQFDDSTVMFGEVVLKNYNSIGRYNITLTVTDNNGSTNTSNSYIIVQDCAPNIIDNTSTNNETNISIDEPGNFLSVNIIILIIGIVVVLFFLVRKFFK